MYSTSKAIKETKAPTLADIDIFLEYLYNFLIERPQYIYSRYSYISYDGSFISAIKKVMNGNTQKQSFIELKDVEFVTYKSLGVEDYLEFKYDIESFDKIIEFNGFYVIKFVAKVTTNGKYIFEEHRVSELDKKYEQKAKK
jgi:hypothetical protein